MIALSSRPFCPCDGRRVSLSYLAAGLRYTTHQPLKGIVCDIGRGTHPSHHQSPLVQQQTEFAPNNPTVIREAFPADLLGTPAFAYQSAS